ncbi:MAG: RHS repeat-associated core domain-containing protein, partial [Ekhidna sp.]
TGWDAFELRMYDGRMARWMSDDPYRQYHSPYVSMGNNPVSMVDPDGGKFLGLFKTLYNPTTYNMLAGAYTTFTTAGKIVNASISIGMGAHRAAQGGINGRGLDLNFRLPGYNFIGFGPEGDPSKALDENDMPLKPVDELDLLGKIHDQDYFDSGKEGLDMGFDKDILWADIKLRDGIDRLISKYHMGKKDRITKVKVSQKTFENAEWVRDIVNELIEMKSKGFEQNMFEKQGGQNWFNY